jgi:Ribonuclease G/E
VSVTVLAACGPGEVRVAACDGGELLDYAIWRPGAPDGVGDLHRGRVIARVPAMAGAFVAIGGADGFLPDSDGAAELTEGAVIGVRVTRAAQNAKGPRLTARLAAEDQARIGTGRPALLRRGPGAVEVLAARFPQASVRADDPALVAALRPALGKRIALANGLAFDEALESELAALAGPCAALPGGGRLSIHPTPALTAIDLDAGGAAGGRGGKGAAHHALNAAALPVLARQIRLRNLSGAILVDWAGLSPRRRSALGPALEAALATDPLRPKLLGFTALGLAEIVRARVHPPLHEVLPGPHAAGLVALRYLVAEARSAPARPRALRAAPAIVAALRDDAAARDDVARLTGRPLALRSDPSLGPAQWRIDAAEG